MLTAAPWSGIPEEAVGLGVSLAVGLLIGLERERNKRTGPMRAPAGVRTFALLGLTGAIASLIGTAGILVTGLFVTAAVVVSYRRTHSVDPGLTTEVAMLVTYLLGIISMSMPAFAGGLGVIVTMLLAAKQRLHTLSRQWLSEHELQDLLILAASALVILPLLPDRTIDPWEAINPRKLWLLVVAVMSIASAGYLALRVFGSRLGLAIAGLAGGFVSSTATIGAMAERAKGSPALAAAAGSAAVMSNVGTIVQLGVIVATLSKALLLHLALPLSISGAVAIIAAAATSWKSFAAPGDVTALGGGRPFKVAAVLRFVALMGGIMLLAAMLRSFLGDSSLYVAMAVSGLADVHAAAAAAAQAASTDQISMRQASVCILIALTANASLKCLIASLKGTLQYALRVVPGIVAMVTGFALSLWMG